MCVGISCSITLTEEKIKQYAFLSGDVNPIHLDSKEAKRFGFKAPIAHGMLTMGLSFGSGVELYSARNESFSV